MSETFNFQIGNFLLFFTLLFQLSNQLSLNEYLTLNHEQKLKLDEFRKNVVHKIPYDYMREDVYLIRWLRDRDFDVAAAERRLFNHLAWRKENHIDHILEEDWSDFDYDFKISVEGCDKDKKPVISMRVGDWDLRRYAISGKIDKLMRFTDKIFEEAELMIRRMRAEGENVTQAIMIFELSNFNLIQQGCARCLPALYHIAKSYTENYTGTVHKIFGVNSPQLALPIWEALKGFMSKPIRDVLVIYGKDTLEWKTALLKEIDEDQLSKVFGGTKEDVLDFQDLRTTNDIIRCSDL